MGPAYDSNPRLSWNPSVAAENGDRIDGISDRMAAMGVSESSESSSIYQVMKAVEDAENTIKQQMVENQQLKDEILRQSQELEKYKSESISLRPSSDVMREGRVLGPHTAHVSNIPGGNEVERFRWMDINSSTNPQGTVIVLQNGTPETSSPALQINRGNQQYSESTKINGYLKVPPGAQTGVDSAAELTAPSRSFSPTRHRKGGEHDPRYTSSGQVQIPVSKTSSNNLWKQELAAKVKEREEEIAMLRKHLADYSVKEAQICNEKYVLEKRIAYMRMAFDQQQQDLVDAASKALSYRQDIIEENIRLTYALQAAQQERSIFVSSLLPLLTECNLQPAVLDAQSIVSNLRVLFKHLQEKLILTEEKLKESQYQLAPLSAEMLNNSYIPPQSPPHSLGAAVANSNKSREIVPQPVYSHAQSPISSPSNAQTKLEWEALSNQNRHTGPSGFVSKIPDQDGLERISPSISSAESKDQNPSFKDLVRGNEIDDPELTGLQHDREATVHWGPGDDPNSSYPYLPPVLEEPSSSFSEAAEDDPLPAIEELQISGEAFPGRVLQACGYSINGTTSCNFEWVRYLEDGSVNYIEEAKQPNYQVTADDVDSYLAIEVHPLDDKKRKGELVKVFANEHRKITCDPEMRKQIEKTLSIGQMSFEVFLSAKYLDIWEQAVLAIKREAYSVKCNGPQGVVVTEKFLPTTSIAIPYGNPTEFSIQCANGNEYLLRAKDSWLRDTIVLTMRLFKKMAIEKRKGRKKGLFFKS